MFSNRFTPRKFDERQLRARCSFPRPRTFGSWTVFAVCDGLALLRLVHVDAQLIQHPELQRCRLSFSAAAQALAERSKACERSEGCHLLRSRGAALAPSGQIGPVPMICECQCQWRTYGAARLRSHCACRGSRRAAKPAASSSRKRGSDCAATIRIESTWTFSRSNGNGSTNGSTSFRFTGFLRSPLSRSRRCAADSLPPTTTHHGTRPLYSLYACHVRAMLQVCACAELTRKSRVA